MADNGNNHNSNGNGNGGGELTGLQRAFVDAWFDCRFNGVKAAEQAGYQGSYSTLGSVACANLKKPKIQEAIAERWAAHGVTAEEVAARFAGWARFDPSVLFHPHGGIDWDQVRKHGQHIKKVTWDKGNKLSVEWHDPMRAAELLARTLGMFRDRVEEEHTGEVVIRFAKPAEFPE